MHKQCTHKLRKYERKYFGKFSKITYTTIVCPKCYYDTNKEKIQKQRKEREARKKLFPCVFCGFKPVHKSQMDWDHKDGNHKNNDPSNLQLLCANCHRLKSVINKDWRTYKDKGIKDIEYS